MMDRRVFFALSALAFLIFCLLLIYLVVAPFLSPLAWAAILAVSTHPLYRSVRRRLEGRDNLAAALTTPALILLLAIPVLLVLLFLIVELDALYDAIQIDMMTGEFPTLKEGRRWPILSTLSEYLQPIMEDLDINPIETITPALQNLLSQIVEQSKNLASSFFRFGLQFMVFVVALFFAFRDGEKLLRYFGKAIPLPPERKKMLAARTQSALTAVLYGVFLTALVQGNLAFAGYWLAGLPSPVLLGVATALASLVPVVGTALVWVPGGLYLLFNEKVLQGVFLLAWGTFIVGSSDNLIRPYFISGRGHIHFLIVLIGVLGGLYAFGMVGIVLGPVILTLAIPLLDIYGELLPSEEPRIVPPEGP